MKSYAILASALLVCAGCSIADFVVPLVIDEGNCGAEEFLAFYDNGDPEQVPICCEGFEGDFGNGDVQVCEGRSCVVVDERASEVECCDEGELAGHEDDGDAICCVEYNPSTNYAECGDDDDGCLYFEGGRVDCCPVDETAYEVQTIDPFMSFTAAECCSEPAAGTFLCGGKSCVFTDPFIVCETP